MRWAMSLLANFCRKQGNWILCDSAGALQGGAHLGSASVDTLSAAFSKAQQVTHLDEEKPAVRIIRRTLRGDKWRCSERCAGMQGQVAETIVVADIDRRPRMQQIGQQHIGRELFCWRDRAAVEAAEVGLQIEETGIGERRVVIEDQTQRQFLRELVVQFGAVQVIVEDALSGRKWRRCPAGSRPQAVVNQRFVQTETGRWPQREPEIHAPGISEKRKKPGRRKKILAGPLDIARGKRNPFVGLRGGGDRHAVLAEINAIEKFVRFAAADVEGGLFLQIHLKADGRLPVLQNAGVIPVQDLERRGTEIDDLAFFRPPEIAAEPIVLADVDAVDKSQLGAKIGRKVVVIRRKSKVPPGVRSIEPERIPLLRTDAIRTLRKPQTAQSRIGILPRPGVHGLRIHNPVLRKLQPRIERSHAITGVRKIAARSKSANVGLLSELARDSNDSVDCPRRVGSTGETEARLPVVNEQCSQRPLAELSGHAPAELRG